MIGEARIRRSMGPLLGAVVLLLGPVGGGPLAGEPPVTPAHKDCDTSCHKLHGGESGQVLLKRPEAELCLSCHRGQNPTFMGGRAPQLPSPGSERSSHIPGALDRKGREYTRTLQVGGHRVFLGEGCTGCHDPHLEKGDSLKKVAFNELGEYAGDRAAFPAQVCFGCHAGPSAVRTLRSPEIGALVRPGVRSRHGMRVRPQDRPDLPSLRRSLSSAPLDCTSCHDSPEGPRGPHGSPYIALLKAPYSREFQETRGIANSGALCYSCHQQASIEADESFPYHRQHITGFAEGTLPPTPSSYPAGGIGLLGEWSGLPAALRPRSPVFPEPYLPGFGQPAPCATCHDPHGSPGTPFLVVFDPAVVRPAAYGGPEFRSQGPRHGTCTLSCHGHEHLQTAY